MQTEKAKWVEEVLGSADMIGHPAAPDMTGHVLSLSGKKASSSVVWRIAASVLLLLALNIGTLYVHSITHRSDNRAMLIDMVGSDKNQIDVGTLFFGN